ncbi:MAG: hypothetical protein R8K53_05645, partial [Mariprofundaceae bacterium]
NHIDIHAEAEKLAVFDARLQLLGLHGTLQLNGNIDLQRSDGMPLTGNIHATWDKAASLLLPALQSGKIRANLASKNSENAAPIWQWSLESEPQSVHGKGEFVTNGSHIENWLLRGNIHLQGSGKATGNVLSGTLGAPHWQ